MADTYPTILVSSVILRQMFNDGTYEEQLQQGELRIEKIRDAHPTSPKAPVPHCTRSQMLKLVDLSGNWVAIVHRYLKPDGTPGASGRLDPKKLLVAGIIYAVELP